MSAFFKKLLSRFGALVNQSQEFTLWLPGLFVLTVIAYSVIGGITHVTGDTLAWLVELPARCCYAAAALSGGWVIKRVYLHDLSREDEVALHLAAESGDAGARWILIKDRLETLVCIGLMAAFFWPAQ